MDCRSALLVRSTLRGNCDRSHASDEDHTPPGGATALIAVIGSEHVHQLGFLYILSPVALGALIMLVVALIVNNLTSFRRYPVFWW